MTTIYIAGPIKGKDYEAVSRQFKQVQDSLEAQHFRVINPIKVVLERNIKRIQHGYEPLTDEVPGYRRRILALTLSEMMRKADVIYMMPGWETSTGATIEHEVAQRLGLKVVYCE